MHPACTSGGRGPRVNSGGRWWWCRQRTTGKGWNDNWKQQGCGGSAFDTLDSGVQLGARWKVRGRYVGMVSRGWVAVAAVHMVVAQIRTLRGVCWWL